MCSAGKHKSHNKDKKADSPAGPRTCTEPTETQKEGDRRRGAGDVLRRKRAAHGGTTITHCSTRADSPDHGKHRAGVADPTAHVTQVTAVYIAEGRSRTSQHAAT